MIRFLHREWNMSQVELVIFYAFRYAVMSKVDKFVRFRAILCKNNFDDCLVITPDGTWSHIFKRSADKGSFNEP